MAILHQRLQHARAAYVHRVLRRGGDRVDGRHRDRMPRLRPAQRARREHADHDHSDAALGGVVEKPAEVLRRKLRRQGVGRARVQEVEADLRRLHHARVQHLVERGRLAEGGHAVEADLALLDEPDQRRHDRVAHVLDRHAAAVALARDEVVALQQVDAREAQALEALLQRARDGGRQLGGRHVGHAELRADVEPRLERADHLTEVRLRLAIAVDRRGVEVIDAQLQRARHGPLALRRRAADEQAAHVATTEAEGADAEPRPSERAIVHTSATSRGAII